MKFHLGRLALRKIIQITIKLNIEKEQSTFIHTSEILYMLKFSLLKNLNKKKSHETTLRNLIKNQAKE